MNAPVPTLTSSTSAAGALGDLLAHDRGRDQRDRLDRAGHVAQRVELLVRRGQPGAGGADDGADVLELGEHLLVGQRRPPARDRLELVQRAAGVAQARARRAAGTATPHAATSGASGRVILSPTPPVECLSAVGRESAEKSIRSPDAIIAAVQRAISRRFIPLSRIAIASADICSSATSPRV